METGLLAKRIATEAPTRITELALAAKSEHLQEGDDMLVPAYAPTGRLRHSVQRAFSRGGIAHAS